MDTKTVGGGDMHCIGSISCHAAMMLIRIPSAVLYVISTIAAGTGSG